MELEWHGLSCFSIHGKNATVITDPYDVKVSGVKPKKLSGDVVLGNIDNPLHHSVEQFGKETVVFDWPGEYEAKNVIVQAIAAHDRPKDKDESAKKEKAEPVLIFTMMVDGFRICHLSNLGHKLTPEMLEAVGNIDILLVPVGGNMDAKKAHEVIEQLDPRVVIPMYYKVPGVKMALADVETFLKEVGAQGVQREKSIKYQTPSQLPQDKMEFKVLEPMLG